MYKAPSFLGNGFAGFEYLPRYRR